MDSAEEAYRQSNNAQETVSFLSSQSYAEAFHRAIGRRDGPQVRAIDPEGTHGIDVLEDDLGASILIMVSGAGCRASPRIVDRYRGEYGPVRIDHEERRNTGDDNLRLGILQGH